MKICELKGCKEKHSCNGYCKRHDSQVRRGKKPTLITVKTHRPAIIEGNIAKLQLSLSDEYALVDKEFAYLDKYKWNKSSTGYAKARINSKTTALHKVILSDSNITVDHINRNRLDNRTVNLRPCTPKQNSANRNLSKANKSGYTGVVRTPGGKWLVAFNKKYAGTFENIYDAANKYNELAVKRWGKFANLNNITSKERI